MSKDASFLDADPRPIALRAEDEADLQIISALIQDAILSATEIHFDARSRRLALFINRFRWEDAEQARHEGRPFERVRALLIVHDVQKLRSDGVDGDDNTILELLTLDWTAGEDGTGTVSLAFAGDGTLAVDVECINLDLRDVTQPYLAPSGKVPSHPE